MLCVDGIHLNLTRGHENVLTIASGPFVLIFSLVGFNSIENFSLLLSILFLYFKYKNVCIALVHMMISVFDILKCFHLIQFLWVWFSTNPASFKIVLKYLMQSPSRCTFIKLSLDNFLSSGNIASRFHIIFFDFLKTNEIHWRSIYANSVRPFTDLPIWNILLLFESQRSSNQFPLRLSNSIHTFATYTNKIYQFHKNIVIQYL